jgi:hypothetical protein
MEHYKPSICVLIAVELGAEWPVWVAECRPSAARSLVRRVSVQAEGELPEAFADRAAARLESLSHDHAIGVVVLSCNQRADAAAEQARLSFVTSAAKLLPNARTVVAADRASGPRLRTSLERVSAPVGPLGTIRYGTVIERRISARPARESGHVCRKSTVPQISSLVP